MTYKDTEALIQKYLNGETTTEEERLLAIEVSREDVPDDWKVIAEMLGCLTVDEALFDQIVAERKRKLRIVRLWPWLAAACVAALLIVFLGPPKEVVPKEPQIAKVETGQKKKPLPQPLPREGSKKPTLNSSRREKPNPNRSLPKGRENQKPPPLGGGWRGLPTVLKNRQNLSRKNPHSVLSRKATSFPMKTRWCNSQNRQEHFAKEATA